MSTETIYVLLLITLIKTEKPATVNVVNPSGDASGCTGYQKLLPALPGYGYDVLTYEVKEKIFDFTYKTCNVSQDGVYLIPDQVEMHLLANDPTNYIEATELINIVQYVPVSATGVYKFSRRQLIGLYSVEEQEAKRIFRSSNIVRVDIRKPLYSVNFRQSITEGFKADLVQISNEIVKSNDELAEYYSDLMIQKYGFQFMRSIILGGILAVEYEVSKELKSPANVDSLRALFIKTFNVSTSQETRATSEPLYNSSKMYVIGGQNYDGFKASDWITSVELQPAIISAEFHHWSVILDTAKLPVPSQLEKIVQKYLVEAVSRYSTYNSYSYCSEFASDYTFSEFNSNAWLICKENASEYFTFGGVYQTCEEPSNEQNFCKDFVQKNPLTGNYSCPVDFHKVLLLSRTIQQTVKESTTTRRCANDIGATQFHQIRQTCLPEETIINVQYKTYWCYTSASENRPGLSFGGIYNSRSINPHTGDKTCPDYYQILKIDRDINICVSPESKDFDPATKFGGFFLSYVTFERRSSRGNPLVDTDDTDLFKWQLDCPDGYVEHFATINMDYSISYCTLPQHYKLKDSLPQLAMPTIDVISLAEPRKETLLLTDHFEHIYYRISKAKPWVRAKSTDELERVGLYDLYRALVSNYGKNILEVLSVNSTDILERSCNCASTHWVIAFFVMSTIALVIVLLLIILKSKWPYQRLGTSNSFPTTQVVFDNNSLNDN